MTDVIEVTDIYADWTEEKFIDALTDKQVAFCKRYVIHFNGAKAAREVGHSESSAKEIACENLTKPHIKAYINFLAKNLIDPAEYGIERIIREYAKGAFFDFKDLFDENGNMIHPSKLPRDVRTAIVGFEVEVIGRFGDKPEDGEEDDRDKIMNWKYKLADRKGYLDSLAKIQQMFVDRKIVENNVNVQHGISPELEEVMGAIYRSPGSK